MFVPFVTFIASLLIWFLFLGLLFLWLVDGRIKKEQVLHAVLAVLIAWTVTVFIKSLFPNVRPYVYNNIRPITLTVPTDGAFPSTHAAVAFALATTIYIHDRKVGVIFGVEAALVALARIVADVHYPIDIVAGAILGTFIAWGIGKTHLFGLLKRRP